VSGIAYLQDAYSGKTVPFYDLKSHALGLAHQL
jgi:hypothetical protein